MEILARCGKWGIEHRVGVRRAKCQRAHLTVRLVPAKWRLQVSSCYSRPACAFLTQLRACGLHVTAVFLWGAADFAGGYGSRRANAFVLTAFSHVCAFVLMTAIALSSTAHFLRAPASSGLSWRAQSGGFSLAVFYGALASGQMGLTAPIAALMGAAIPTLVDIAMEGAPSRWTIAGFMLAFWRSG